MMEAAEETLVDKLYRVKQINGLISFVYINQYDLQFIPVGRFWTEARGSHHPSVSALPALLDVVVEAAAARSCALCRLHWL